MGQRSGYKANRKSIAQKRREYREKIWRESDVPPAWEDRMADKGLMEEMLKKFNRDASSSET